MKWQAVIVLLALAVAVAAPPALMCGSSNQTTIGVIDVCHHASPAVSSSGEMPCMNVQFCFPFPAISITYSDRIAPFFAQNLLTFDSEQPPKA